MEKTEITKYSFIDKSEQRNTLRNVLKDLEKELDVLYTEKEVGEKKRGCASFRF